MGRRATVFGGFSKISMSSISAADSQDRTVSGHEYFSKRSVLAIFYGSISCDTILFLGCIAKCIDRQHAINKQ